MVKPFDPENFPYTLIHDDLADVIADQLSGSAFKLLYFIMRKSRTDFTHFRPVRLPYIEILTFSGIKSRTTIGAALQELIDLGLISQAQVGIIPGINHPIFDYSLNLNYSTENGMDSPKTGLGSTESVLSSSPKTGLGSTESVLSSTESVPMHGQQESVLLQSAPQSTEQGGSGNTDHDHDDDDHVLRNYSDKDLIARFRRIKVYNAHARQIIDKHGLDGAWRWYAYVLDQGNNVDLEKVERYLWTAALKNSDSPPIPYRLDQIDELEATYYRRLAARQTQADATNTPAERAEPVPADPLAQLWDRVLVELRGQMTPAAFDQWMAETGLVSVEGGLAVVSTSNHYANEWLTARLKPAILRTLAAVAESSGHTIQDVIFEEVSYVQNPA